MEYLFFIEGLNREVWQAGASSKFARAALWASLTDTEQNAVVQIECIDERETQSA
jgi:hypothetical protein